MPVAAALEWIDNHFDVLGSEVVDLAQAAGRVLAESLVAPADLPAYDRAAIDGLVLRADETAGASAYNPLLFRASAPGPILAPGGAAPIGAGDRLPEGADVVLPLEHVETRPASYDVIEAAAAGSGIEYRASQWARGEVLLTLGRPLISWEIGLLAAAGVSRVRVVRRPRIRCLRFTDRPPVSGAPSEGNESGTNGPLLRALVERDGGVVIDESTVERGREQVRDAFLSAPADLIITVGGTGSGADDHAAPALAEAGQLAAHGLALSPGETAGFGRLTSGVPAFLLPGTPTACLWAYELLAGRAVRRLSGRDPALPFATRQLETTAKIVSRIGTMEICPVRRRDEQHVTPIASFAAAGLGAVARADGFVIVDAGSEGFPKGTPVMVHLRDAAPFLAAPQAEETAP
jgi:molybdopterin molybdotransferase